MEGCKTSQERFESIKGRQATSMADTWPIHTKIRRAIAERSPIEAAIIEPDRSVIGVISSLIAVLSVVFWLGRSVIGFPNNTRELDYITYFLTHTLDDKVSTAQGDRRYKKQIKYRK